MKALVVLNPAAGKETYESVRRALGGVFKTSQSRYVVHETVKGDKPGEIVRARLQEGFDLVVAAGGDGTVSDVIDGLVGSSVPLGIIPTGTGNLIARELGIPTEVQEAIELIAGVHRSRYIDAMRIGVVAVDGVAHEYHAIEVAIMNCGILAKMLYPKGPNIRIDDGHLDVLVLGIRTLRDYPRYLFGIFTGRPGKLLSRFIEAERDISIQSNVPLAVQADGDIIGTTPIEVELLPGAVCVFVPEEAGSGPERVPDRKAVL
jgi:diacylglycerol kinase (ATP)